MNVSKDDAQSYLEQIHEIFNHTKRKIAASVTGPLLIMWGAIWFVAFLGTYLSSVLKFRVYLFNLTDHISIGIEISGIIWIVLVTVGMVASWILGVKRAPVKSPHDKLFGFSWLILFIYAILWLALLWPWNHYQMTIFFASIPMFAYVIMGLWADRLLFWLGLVVTLLIIVGFFLFHYQPLFWLWMAVLGGGALAGTGLYIRRAWR